jgi:hypothetical protein
VLPRRARTATASTWSSATTMTSTRSAGCPWATRLPSGAALTSPSSMPTARASPWPTAGGTTPRAVFPTPTRQPGASRS